MRYKFLRFPGGKLKAVTLSYDDGIQADLRLVDVINRYGMKCTFNINTNGFSENKPNKLKPDVIKERILGTGHEVAVHGERHIAPGVAEPSVFIADVLNCRMTMEKEFGGIIRGMAYPDSGITRMHGNNNYNDTRTYLRGLGIAYSRTLGGDNNTFHLPTDWYAWMPTAHHVNPNLMDWAESFVSIKEEALYSAARFPRLFYLWGHSFEFDRNDNWELLDEFCALISGKEDTWYATNIEIYDYVEAYRSLITSADGNRIYNPTLKEIWMDIDTRPYSIKPGETLELS